MRSRLRYKYQPMAQNSVVRRFSSTRHSGNSRHDRQVRPANLPLLHLLGNDAIGFAPTREHEHARRVALETLMNSQVSSRFSFERKVFGQTTHDIVATFGRVRGQKRRFVDDHHIRVFMKEADERKWRPKRFERHEIQFCVMFVPAGGVNVNSAGSIFSG